MVYHARKGLPRKIISGGQTGVDRAALRAALAAGLDTGGWCPPDGKCENGAIPPAFSLTPTEEECSERAPNIPRSLRTERNVRDSDATCILRTRGVRMGRDKGTDWTEKCAALLGKPLLIVDVEDEGAGDRIARWIERLDIHTLNVAGPSESVAPGIDGKAFGIMADVLSTFRRVSPNP